MKIIAYASLLVLAFVLGGLTVRPFKSPEGYGGGIPAFGTPNDDTPPTMGMIICDVSGNADLMNIDFAPKGLHGASITVTGQCDSQHGPHPLRPNP